jgi:hypothetical protein
LGSAIVGVYVVVQQAITLCHCLIVTGGTRDHRHFPIGSLLAAPLEADRRSQSSCAPKSQPRRYTLALPWSHLSLPEL